MALGDATRALSRRHTVERALTQHWHHLAAHDNPRAAHGAIANVAQSILDALDEAEPKPQADFEAPFAERRPGFASPEARRDRLGRGE